MLLSLVIYFVIATSFYKVILVLCATTFYIIGRSSSALALYRQVDLINFYDAAAKLA